MDEQGRIIRLSVPGLLEFRDVAVRAVAAACRLVGKDSQPAESSAPAPNNDSLDLSMGFDAEVVSAVSEIFNNIAIHGYGGRGGGSIVIELVPTVDRMTVQISDTGKTFDLDAVPAPELEALPENGMGIHIARACVDEIEYEPGPPNVWRLTKLVSAAHGHTPGHRSAEGSSCR